MNIKRVAVVCLGVLLWAAQAMASQWDDQITQWKKESINLKADQIPQLEEAAKSGDVRATYLLYLETDNARFEYSKRSSVNQLGQWSQRIADAGNPIGMRMLCYLLSEGQGGLSKDQVSAFEWCKKGALAGFGNAMSGLGVAYRDGEGVKKDAAEAVKWFRKGADLKDGTSIASLGNMYRDGRGVTKDEAEAVKLFRRGAELNNINAILNLGYIYLNGKGVAKDEAEAFKWYKKAADLNDVSAMQQVGSAYYRGNGVAKNYADAAKWYRKAAQFNDVYSINFLGYMHKNGEGVIKDESEAYKWYLKAAELNDVPSIRYAGVAYRDGKGVAKNDIEAMKWFLKGASLKDPLSMVFVGDMHRSGNGVVKNIDLAKVWFLKATEANKYPYANTLLGELYEFDFKSTEFVKDVIPFYTRAADAGEAVAMVHLAGIYADGKRVSKNINLAANWYVKALSKSTSSGGSFDNNESAELRARRFLDAMLAAGEITDTDVLREVRALSKPAPKAEWVQAPQTTSDEEVTFQVSVVDGGGGIGDVSFKLSGVALNVAQGRNAAVIELANTNVRTFKFRLPPGKHDVEVIAYNAENLINWTSLKSTVTSTFKPIRKPQLHAVIVGINDYENDKLKLRFATNDATEVAKVLKASGEKLYDQVHVKLLNTRGSTGKTAILQAIKEAASKAGTEDVFVFYVAGHGVNFEDKGYHMLTADVGQTSDKAIQERSISTKELQSAIYDVPSLKKVVLLDTCQSGGGLDATKLIRPRGLDDRDMVKELNRKSGAVVLAAAESQQDAMEGYQGHGIFTFVLLEALQGKADTKGDGFVSTHQLLEYIPDRTYTLAQQAFNGKKQWPSTSGKDGFPFLKWK